MSTWEVSESLRLLLGATIISYLVVIYVLSIWVRRRIRSTDDYVVAGRRLPLPLSWATLLATWFGAGTMLTAADEVARGGLRRAALDPFGAGCCLIIAGLFFATPLWRMKLLTICDFFRRRFGASAELVSACVMVPSYFGWIAAQFVALAGMLHLFFDWPMVPGICLVAAVGTGYTLLGGMWSVTMTDALQISLVLLGLMVLAVQSLATLGGGSIVAGWETLAANLSPEMLQPVDTESLQALFAWLSVFCIGALGNIPGQDLMQRIFASRSARVARWACLLAGAAYLSFGLLPILLGLVGKIVFSDDFGRGILPALAHVFLSPVFAVVFILALLSAVLSTIDSAILSPATVLAQNVFARFVPRARSLLLNHLAVLIVAGCALAMALLGESAYSLLEDAYELTLVGLLAPLVLGLYTRRGGVAAATASMLAGSGFWLLHHATGWENFFEPCIPEAWQFRATLPCTLASFATFWLIGRCELPATEPLPPEHADARSTRQ